MKRNNYNTKQKQMLFDIIKNYKHDFTIKDIYETLNGSVGLTTIYRYLNELEKNGNLEKFVGKDKNNYYQFVEVCNHTNHFYLKCTKCEKMIHVDCDCIEEVTNHILKEHNFIPSNEHLVLFGICESCK